MSIFLKIMVIFNFLIALAAGAGAWLIFEQRDILKERIQIHERNWPKVAEALQVGGFGISAYADDDETKWGNWASEPDDTVQKIKKHIQNPVHMEAGMKELAAVAEDRVQMMALNRVEWDKMIGRLSDTNIVLATTAQNLKNTEDDLDERTTERDDLDSQVKVAMNQIGNLNAEKQGLQADINNLESDMSKINAAKTKVEENLQKSEEELLAKTEELRQCISGYKGINTVEEYGKIVAIQPDYNFVIINLGRQNKVQLGSQAMVHRGDELVAKINITQVDDEVSVGTVDDTWQLKEIKTNDQIIFL